MKKDDFSFGFIGKGVTEMKTVNRNLLLLGLPALLIFAVGIGLFCLGDDVLRVAQSAVPQAPGSDVGDVEGYAFLIQFFGAGLGHLAGIFALIAGILLIAYGGVMIVLNVVARIVYKATPGRLLAYRILIGTDLVVLLLPTPSLLFSCAESALAGYFSAASLAMPLILIALAAFAIRNTYTWRIVSPAPGNAPESV